MAEYIDKSEIYRRYFNGGCGVVRMHVSDIDVIPAADVSPVVHGRWIPKDYMIPHSECSVCKSEVRTDDYGDASPYCPWCGAKMDDEDLDGPDIP